VSAQTYKKDRHSVNINRYFKSKQEEREDLNIQECGEIPKKVYLWLAICSKHIFHFSIKAAI
jgi:hypothetical protein